MILRHPERTGDACPNSADGGLPNRASEEAVSQDASKGRFYAPKSFAIGSQRQPFFERESVKKDAIIAVQNDFLPVSYTHLTLPTNREV